MSRTITGHSTAGIMLSRPQDNPVTVAGAASVITTGTYALYGTKAVDWSITNSGKLRGGTVGITLAGSGSITNAADASISDYSYGVKLSGPGTIVNSGAISGSGKHGTGVVLADSGPVMNAAGATIAGGGRAGDFRNGRQQWGSGFREFCGWG